MTDSLGDLIRKYRIEHLITIQEFADKSGLSKGHISMLERNISSRAGKPLSPTLDTYNAVAKGLGMSLTNLLETMGEEDAVSKAVDEPASPIQTIAAHLQGTKLSDKDMEDITDFLDYIKFRKKK